MSAQTTESGSVFRRIKGAEDLITYGFYRVEALERKLKLRHLSVEDREQAEKELEECKEELNRNQKMLKDLQKENSKSFMVSAIMLFLCFLVFGTYKMYQNHLEK